MTKRLAGDSADLLPVIHSVKHKIAYEIVIPALEILRVALLRELSVRDLVTDGDIPGSL